MCLINVQAKPLFDVVESNCVDTLQKKTVCKIDISNDLNTISFAHNSLINLHNIVIQHNEIILNLDKLREISWITFSSTPYFTTFIWRVHYTQDTKNTN